MSMNEPSQWEAAKAALGPVASLLKRYHADLIEAGFSRDEAMTIIIAVQRDMLARATTPKGA